MNVPVSFSRRVENRWRIIHALMMREALGKHGHETLGFFWIIGEPLFLLTGIVVLWSIAHITHGSGVDVIPFALTAYSFLTLWRHIAGGAVRVMRTSRNLSFFRQLQLIDVMFSKAVLETISLFSTFIIAYIPLFLLQLCPGMNDPLLLVGGFFFTGWFSLAFALLLASASEVNETFHHLIAAIMYITLPVTGAFTMQDWLPASVQKMLSWSPLVNCVEMIRGGLFSTEVVVVHYNVPYLIACCSCLTCVGIIAFMYVERIAEA